MGWVMFRSFGSAIRFSYATVLGLVLLTLALLVTFDVVLEASDVSEGLPQLLVPAVPAVIGLVTLALQPRGWWLLAVCGVLLCPLVLGMLGTFMWSDEPATAPLHGLHGWIITALGTMLFLWWGALVVGIWQALRSRPKRQP
jgi:hypothetical protein